MRDKSKLRLDPENGDAHFRLSESAVVPRRSSIHEVKGRWNLTNAKSPVYGAKGKGNCKQPRKGNTIPWLRGTGKGGHMLCRSRHNAMM